MNINRPSDSRRSTLDKKNKAVFLDRDGVLIKETGGYNYRLNQVEMVESIYPFLKKVQAQGYLLIMITNQGGIDKKLFTHEDVKTVNDFILNELAQQDIQLDDIYYCPHHSEISLCICRKPDSGMLEKALAKHRIDATKSYFIGDHDRDIIAGDKAGVTSIKIEANLSDFEPLLGLIR